MVDNDQLELFRTGCFWIRLVAYYANECISENCLSHKNASHVQSSRTSENVRKQISFTEFLTLLRLLTKKASMNGNKRVVTSS